MPHSPAGKALAIALGAMALAAPSGSSPNLDDQAGPLRVTIRVTDAGGQPVRGLSAEDLTVTVGGTPARIASLREIQIEPGSGRPVVPTDAAASTSDVVTNAPPLEGSRLIAIAVDEDGLPPEPEAISRLRTVLVDLLAAAGPRDDVSLLSRLRAPRPEHSGFGRDREALDAALDRTVRMHRFRTMVGEDAVPHRNRLAHETLRALMRAMAGTGHDHRVLVVVGSRLDQPEPDPRTREYRATEATLAERAETIRVARETGVALYVVDLRQPRIPRARASLDRERDGLHGVLEATGGGVVAPETETIRAARRIFGDSEALYVAEVELADAAAGAPVEVTARIAALTARAMPSRTVDPPVAQADLLARALHGFVRFGVPLADLAVHAAVAPIARGSDGSVRTALTVDASQLESGTAFGSVAQLHIVAFDESDAVLRVVGVSTTVENDRLTWHGELDLLPDTTRLGIGVRASENLAAGTVSVPVEMPDFALPLSMSALVIGWPGQEDAPPRSALPFAPSLVRSFIRSEPPTVFARIFWRSSRVSQVVVTTGIRRMNGDVLASRTDTLRPPADAAGDERDAELRFPMPSSQLMPGDYEVFIEATGTGAGGTVTRSVGFVVR